jgi:rhamnose transport system substrate-binding protein
MIRACARGKGGAVPLSKLWRGLIVAGLVLAVAVLVAACGSGSSSTSGGGSGGGGGGKSAAKPNVAFIPKSTDQPYFAAVGVGAQEAAKELGGQYKQVGTAAPSVPDQVRLINSLAQRQQPVIAVSALDPNAVAPALKQAQTRGSKIISYDADVKPDARTLFINQASEEALGVGMAKLMAEDLNNKGDYAILSAQITAANQNAWIKWMKTELAKPQYSGMKLVKIAYGNDEAKKSYDEAVSLIQGYPSLKGIICPTPISLEASVKALDDLGKKGVKVTGLGFPPSDAELLLKGKVNKFILWSPRQLGYLSYFAAAALQSGKITGKPGESFDAGKLGKKTIGENGQVLLGPPLVFTKANVNAKLSEFATK